MSTARERHAGRGRGMHPLGRLLPFDQALRLALRAARPTDRTERVPVPDAESRVAAETVRSPIDVPLAARAAMDGYAVLAEDTTRARPSAPVSLRRVGQILAGEIAQARVVPGRCLEIATGALIPRGANAVVMVEATHRQGTVVDVRARVAPGENVSRRGEDIRRGAVVVRQGDVLTAAKVGALSAVGRTQVRVYGKPRVAIFTTGDEIVAPGRPLRPGQVYDVNSRTLAAVVRSNGGDPVSLGSAGDRPPALDSILRRALRGDLVVTSGGSSVGSRDLLADLVSRHGRVVFHGIAVRPGRPTVLGLVNRTPVLGMPGHPTSCLMNAYVLLAPMVRRLARLPPAVARSVEGVLAEGFRSPRGKTEFHPVRLAGGRVVSAYRGSSAITSMAHADGFVEIPADITRLRKGARARVVLF